MDKIQSGFNLQCFYLMLNQFSLYSVLISLNLVTRTINGLPSHHLATQIHLFHLAALFFLGFVFTDITVS